MIFVTIGTQEPFDRLIKAVDELALELNLEVLAQVSSQSKIEVKNIKTLEFLPPHDFNRLFSEADLVIAHAGMGTIISSLVAGKPLIVMPRQKKLKEHRSDHQMATAKYFGEMGYINVAENKEQLAMFITDFYAERKLMKIGNIGDFASAELISKLKNVIND